MVEAGEITVKEAGRIADLPKPEQQEIAREGPAVAAQHDRRPHEAGV